MSKKRDLPIYVCPHCKEDFVGNGFSRHEAKCRRDKELGEDAKKIYPVAVPCLRYDAFSKWCKDEYMTLAEGVNKLIKEKVG